MKLYCADCMDILKGIPEGSIDMILCDLPYGTTCSDGKRNPTTILKFPREKGLHPTQKPVKLEEWLIKTYTNPGETVLDNCMGSGTTGVACINTNRDFIGIEKNPDYYKTAISRIKEAQDNGKQGNQKKQPDHD